MDYKQIDDLVNQHSGQITRMIRGLVDIPTENNPPYGFEAKGQDYVEKVFENMALDIDTFAPDEIEGFEQNDAFLQGQNYENGRKNVVGTWQGTGRGKSLVLCGHMDVAPKEPMPWAVCEPYESVVIDAANPLFDGQCLVLRGGVGLPPHSLIAFSSSY